MLVLLAPVLMIVVGLAIDGAGQVQAREQATAVAQEAARAGTNAAAANDLGNGAPTLVVPTAINSAQNYLAAAGVSGTATATPNTVTVTTTVTYQTKFISLIGINSLEGHGTGAAQLLYEAP